jgi:hypothetical protein
VRLPKKGLRPRRFAIVDPAKKFELPVACGVKLDTFDGS